MQSFAAVEEEGNHAADVLSQRAELRRVLTSDQPSLHRSLPARRASPITAVIGLDSAAFSRNVQSFAGRPVRDDADDVGLS
ncbi:hypothetical protein [Kitasatospora sp. NPDC004272]